ncbi:lytic transglycosylase domain-containing protein [Paraburkholderia madseniana]|nr:lytic transglycosylase domain-containing protein [Paraburkholderia madseniana]
MDGIVRIGSHAGSPVPLRTAPRTVAFAVSIALWVGVPVGAHAALYLCRDGEGHEFRMHQTVALSLIDMTCAPLDGGAQPDAQPAALPNRFARPVSIVFPVSADDPLAANGFPALPAALRSPFGLAKVGAPRAALLSNVAPLIRQVASEYREDPGLLMAIVSVESGFNPSAVSPKGAVGLMQLMPATARRFGLQGEAGALFDPQVNLRLGARYLGYLKSLFPNELERVIAAYNAGEGAVMRFGGRIPPFAETQAYVVSVMRAYAQFSGSN